MRTKLLLVIVVVSVSVLGLVFLLGRTVSEEEQDKTTYLNTFTGVGFIHRSADDFVEDLSRANEIGLVFFNAPYDGDIPEVIRVGFEAGYTDLPVPNMAKDTKDIPGLTAAYLKLVEMYQPVFVGLGNEIELMPDKEAFVNAYNGMYTAIKERCSDCIVYPVFQYEQFEPDFVDRMKLDLLAFTSYPFAQYQRIADIPDDYYDTAFAKAEEKGVNVAFTEIGWTHLSPYVQGYDSVEDAQTTFYNRFRELIEGKPVQFVGWGLLYGSPETGAEWADIGLYHPDGTPKERLLREILKDTL